jgi:DNA-binding transcriptional regulator YiaG
LPFCHVTLRARKPNNPAYPKELETLGDHLRAVRLDRGLLQWEVARELRVSVESLLLWETNRRRPQVRLMARVVDFLGDCPWKPARHLGDVLRQAREALGLSQERFAARAAVDPATVCRWETQGRRLPAALARWLTEPMGAVPSIGRGRRRRARRRDVGRRSCV